MPTTTYTLTGRITNRQGLALPQVRVRALARMTPAADRPLGNEAITDGDGRYHIEFTTDARADAIPDIAPGTIPGHARPDREPRPVDPRIPPPTPALSVLIRVLDGDRTLGESAPHQISASTTVVDVVVDAEPRDDPSDPWLRVSGVVRDQFGAPLDDVVVEAFDRDIRNEQLLGTTRVKEGRYDLKYRASQFSRAEKGTADLVMKVMSLSGAELYRAPIRYNAPADLELDITLTGAAYRGPSEWELLDSALMPLLEKLSPLEVREDEQHQDASFLSGETGTDRLTIGGWLACFHLSDKATREETPLGPEVFFAFVRQGQPSVFYDSLLQDMQHAERRALLLETMLRRLAELVPELQMTLLTKAVRDNLVPAKLEPQIPAIVEMLARIRVRYAATATIGGGKGTIAQLLQITRVAPQDQTAFVSALASYSGPANRFWSKLVEEKVLAPEVAKTVKQSFDVGALTRNHVPLVGEIVGRLQRGELKAKRDLAALDTAAWVAIFNATGRDGKPIGVPDNIDGDTPEARTQLFATVVQQQVARAYPTAAFAAKLRRRSGAATVSGPANGERGPLAVNSEVATFLGNNAAFQLDRVRVDHYVARNPAALDGIEDKERVVTELKSVQRVFRLKPTFEAVDALLSRGLDSAQQIYFMGQGQFVHALAAQGMNRIEAKQVYRRAETTYAHALAMFAEYNTAMNGATPLAVPSQPSGTTVVPAPTDPGTTTGGTGVGTSMAAATAAPAMNTLPSLQTLFGSLDYCECTECRSVYSPAAYFVDVMRFLGDRGTQGTGVNAGKSVQQVLLERRPDLGEIELSCENTNTPLPYIDLVNEILEDVVAPPAAVTLSGAVKVDLKAGPIKGSVLTELGAKGVIVSADALVYDADSRGQWAIRDGAHAYKVTDVAGTLKLLPTRQTLLSATELRANPEYTNGDAYTKLGQEVFPLELPFDLSYLQTRSWLAHLGVPYPRLLELFQQKLADDATLVPSDLQIDAAWLGLTETERQVVTGSMGGKQSWDFWGLAQNGNDVPDPQNPADSAANVTGTWIEVLSNVDVMLHRSGLSYKELLQLLDMKYVNAAGSIFIADTADANVANCDTSQFRIRNLTAGALDRAHRFTRLWRRVGFPMWELDMLLPDVDADPNVVDKRISDAALQDISHMSRLRDELGLDWRELYSLYHGIDNNVYLDRGAEGSPPLQTLYQRLFRNKLVDAVASFPPAPEALAGTIATMVPGLLAAFRIKERDLTLILADLGVAATANLTAATLGNIYRVTALAKVLELSVEQILRLKRLWAQDPFAHPGATRKFVELAREVAASEFTVDELDYLLAHRFVPSSGVALEDKAIVSAVEAIREGLRKISDDVRLKATETPEAYVRRKLGQLSALGKDADQAIALAIIDGTWAGTTAARDALIDQFFIDALNVVVAKVNLAALAGGLSPADRQAAVDGRFLWVQPALEAFLLEAQSRTFIRQKIADLLQLDVPGVRALLDMLQLPGKTVSLRETIDDPRLIATIADGSYQFLVDEANFGDIFASLRLLHKNALVITRLHITVAELSWWLDGTHATQMGWMDPAAFPLDLTSQVPIAEWVAMTQFFAWRAGLPKSDLTAFEFATRVLDGTTTSASNISDLAQLTTWATSDIETLAAAFHWLDVPAAFDVVKQQLRNAAALVRLTDAMSALRRLGVNAARAVQWATATPGAADADSLKQTAKAKYDLGQWQEVIRPLQDEFRERKRQALVAWLIAHPDQTQAQNWTDANGLYSHFLIDVEMSACMLTSRLKQAAGSAQLFVQRCLLNLETDLLARADLDPKWKQWKWMRRYRVWEANRKVFLYPENWIEPELRDEKSPFFKELENELMQNDVTNDSAEQAYLGYLEKLDKVANLEIRTMYEQIISQDESTLHVFGRTRSSQSPEYFYRKCINRGRWTAWETVGLDISANHLVAGVHNRRLFLLWPQFLEKSEMPTGVQTPNPNSPFTLPLPAKYWEIRLAWSELKKGKWTPKLLSDSYATVQQSWVGGDNSANVEFRTRLAPQIETRLYTSSDPWSYAPNGRMLFDKVGKQITRRSDPVIEHLIAPAEAHFQNNLIVHQGPAHYFYHSTVDETGKGHTLTSHENAEAILVLGNVDENLTWSVIDSHAKGFPSEGSYFLWDTHRTYFVDYNWRVSYNYFSRAWHESIATSFRFFIHYHPFVELFIKELNIWGIKGLLNRRIQVDPRSVPGSPDLYDFAGYQPDPKVLRPLPMEDVDFSYLGAYAPYNWELFFHVPFFIANKLSANQRFEEALEWFHYIFDPTSTDTTLADPDTPQQKFWITKPFYETTKADYYKQKIENIMLAIAKGDAELRAQVNEWRDNPFNPHLIARMRTVAYQKNVLIKYIQTLVAWGDQLFRQDTIESLNEATQLYVLADSVLGNRPRSVPRSVPNPVKTLYQLQQEGIDGFGNVLKEVENLVPPASGGAPPDPDAPELPYLDVLYFCIPNNDKMLGLWDRVADRLFKIRHCMNIEGVVRQLPLFEPPIDPAMLVKAAAAGIDISAALNDLSAPLPLYRFAYSIDRANQICSQVTALGAAMLSALEHRDAEKFALLRSSHELTMLDQVRTVKTKQVDEAARMWDSLKESRHVAELRRDYHRKLVDDGWNAGEKTAFGLSIASTVLDAAIAIGYIVSGGLKIIPSFLAGGAGFGGTPTVNATMGGQQIGGGAEMAVRTLQSIATALDKGASLASTVASFERRGAEWGYQRDLALRELPQIDHQIAAADLRQQIAQQDLANHDKQKENSESEDEYMREKFTNQELYDWMLNQLATVYFQSYQLAYDIAKRCERSFRYELGLDDSSYIQFGYWDSLKKGLLAGEKLAYDLKRLETAYYEQNRREYELTKHISLEQLDPIALVKLRQNGECFVDIPETAFNMDYPGHYFRRLKSVALSIPCTVGPYTTVACTLTLTSNHLRKDSTLSAGSYDRKANDPRFRDEVAAIQSIATSRGQSDSGMFELDFRDERYLPFEGAGAISSWHIKLNKDFPQFSLATISDVVMHLSYTAREGGELLRSKAVASFNAKVNKLALAENRQGLFRVFDLRHEYPDKWYRFLHPATPADEQAFLLDDLADRLPYFTQGFPVKKAKQIEVVALMKDGATYEAMLSPLGAQQADLLALKPEPTYQGLHRAAKDLTGSEIPFGAWTLKLKPQGAADYKSLPPDAVRELFLIANYTIA